MQLDLGAGTCTEEGWCRLDGVWQSTLHVQARGAALPFRANSLEMVRLNGVFEHFTYAEAQVVLREIARVLVPSGWIDLNAPDLVRFAELLLAVVCEHRWPREWEPRVGGLHCTNSAALNYVLSGFYGGQDRPGMVHQSGWTEAMLTSELAQAGFVKIQCYSYDHNEPQTHLSFRAQKP